MRATTRTTGVDNVQAAERGNEMSAERLISPDAPISTPEEDRFGRAHQAQRYALALDRIDCSDSGAVVGVHGRWGSGKTSFLNLIRASLGPAREPIDFNPWLFSGSDHLVEMFFRELSAQLAQDRRFEAIAARLQRYGASLERLENLPVAGTWVGRLKGVLMAIASLLRGRARTVVEQRAALSDSLRELERPLVIFVDDIDRLNAREVRDIFRLLRLVGNLPNIIYVVAFDRARVASILEEDHVPGEAYLEKILQVTLDLPEPGRQLLANLLVERLNNVLSQVDDGSFDAARWPDILSEILIPLIETPRDVTRFLNGVRLHVVAMAGDIDLVDLLALEAFRVLDPETHARLPHLADALTAPASSVQMTGPTEDDAAIVGVRSLVEDGGPPADALVRRVFPSAARHLSAGGGMHYGHESHARWLRQRRVATRDILSLYIEQQIPAELRDFIEAERWYAVMHDERQLRAVVEHVPASRRQDVIAHLEKFEHDFTPAQVVPGSIVLLEILPTMPSRRDGLFGGDPKLSVRRVALRLLRSLGSEKDRLEAVIGIIDGTSTLSGQLAVLDIAGHRENAGHGLIDHEEDVRLRRSWRDRVRSRTDDELATEWDVGRIMWTVRDDRDDQEPSLEPPRSRELVAALLISLSGESTSQTLGTRHVEHHPRISWELFVDLVGGEEQAQQWVDALRDDDLVRDELVELAQRYADGWRPDEF